VNRVLFIYKGLSMASSTLNQELKALISEKLRQLREKSKQTLEEEAYFLDLDYAQYYRLLKGNCLPSLETLVKINQAYGLDMNWWFNETAKFPEKMTAQIKQRKENLEILSKYNKLDERAREFVRKMLKNL
jgi:transcriptional regulator with XRE-family HTH domain